MTVLACDLGGTRIKIGVVHDCTVLAHEVLPAHSSAGLAPQLPILKDAWLRLLAKLNVSLADCSGVSISFPSLIDERTGRVLSNGYGKFVDASALDLRAWAQANLGLRLAIDNDARMALIGEWQVGAGRGCDDFVMLTLGTGLGVSALIEGRVLRGKHGQAGIQGGHLTLRYDNGRACNCGNVGCAEAEASTAFLAELAATRPDFATSALVGEPVLDFASVFKHAARGDACALALRDHSIHVWATLVVNLVHAYDPELVVIGGGIMASAPVILPAIRAHVDRHAHTPWGRIRIVPSELGDNAALLAGEWLLKDQCPRKGS